MGRRTVFFVSDQTGVTAETMGHTLLTQFEGLQIRAETLPFVSSPDKPEEAVARINRAGRDEGVSRQMGKLIGWMTASLRGFPRVGWYPSVEL